MAVKDLFIKAQEDVKSLTKRPSNDDFLFLYSHFKQASGDVSGSRPGMLDMIGRAKYDAWAKLKGIKAEQAMQAYVDKVEGLLKSHK